MNTPTERHLTTRQQAGEVTQAPGNPDPRAVRGMVTQWGLRHVRGVGIIRLLVAIWLVCLGTFFFTLGDWWGVFLYLTAALVGWLGYLNLRSYAGAR